ncbi:MAG: response regulator [Elusimicrobia bacterium]|nr:response regulator [Elusimicrobiota bacterium]
MGESRKVVLIVDDEAGMRDMLRWTFGGSEFVVVVARDGREAAELLSEGGIDLVVTDVTMPRQGGYDVLEAAAGTRPRTPAIVMTGFGTVEMAVLAMRRGAVDFLLKPFDVRLLAARIRETLTEEARRGSVAPSRADPRR